MTDQNPLYLETSDSTVRRIPSGDRIDPAALGLTGDPVGTSDTQTLTNKTLTNPKVNAISSTVDGTRIADIDAVGGDVNVNWLHIQNATAGFHPLIEVAASSYDTNVNLRLRSKGATSEVTANNVPVVTTTKAQVLTNKTLTDPIISSGGFGNANHNHTSGATGGLLTSASFAAGAGLSRILYVNTATSSAIANTTTGTAFDNMSYSAYLNDILGAVGSTVRLTAAGYFQTTGTPTLRLRLVPSGTGVTWLWDSGAVTMPTAGVNTYWQIQVVFTTRATGGSGVISANQWRDTRGTTTTQALAYNGSFDFTTLGGILAQLELRAVWGTADPANTITCEHIMLEGLN